MEQNNQLIPHKQENNTWETIDCSVAAKTLETDGNNYLKNRLEEYKKADFAPKDMEHINSMCLQITEKPNPLVYNGHNIHDDQKNGFLHIAVRKADLAIVSWFLDNKCWSNFANTEGKEPLDLCIDQLLPHADEKNKKVAYDILDTLMIGYEKANLQISYRKKFLTKLIRLELEHKKNGSLFTLKNSWIKQLLAPKDFNRFRGPTKYTHINLPTMYQTVTDEQKNSYAHILVKRGFLSDELYDCIQKGYISFAKNSAGNNPLDIALDSFQYCSQHSNLDSLVSSTRCCLFMLLNYVKKQQGITDYQQCCDKHII